MCNDSLLIVICFSDEYDSLQSHSSNVTKFEKRAVPAAVQTVYGEIFFSCGLLF